MGITTFYRFYINQARARRGSINLDVFAGDMPGHLDMDKMRKGGFGGGFFAIWVPSPIDLDSKNSQMNLPKYDLPLPSEISVDEALPIAIAQAAILHRMEQAGYVTICTNAAMLQSCLKQRQNCRYYAH